MTRRFMATGGTNGNAWPDAARLWVPTFGAGGAGTADIQSNKLHLVTAAVASYGASARALLKIPCWDVDMYWRVTPAQAWTTESFLSIGLGDNFSGTDNAVDNGWSANLGPSTSELNLNVTVARVGGAALVAPGYTYAASNTVKMRICRIGFSIAVKMWDDTGVAKEPDNWNGISPPTGCVSGPALYPSIGINNGAAGTAIGYSFDLISIDDLQPQRRRTLLVR